MVILDGHANTKTIVKNRNRDVSIMGTVPIVDVFAIVPIISMGRFAKIKSVSRKNSNWSQHRHQSTISKWLRAGRPVDSQRLEF